VILNEINAGSSDRLLKFDNNGVPQVGTGSRWYQSAYNDSLWSSGAGPFGFGTLSNGPTAITTNFQPATQYLTPTVYFRKTFTVSPGDQARPENVQLVIEYNDGFVAYLNGLEVARRNGGPVNKFIYHDQPAYNRETFAGTAPIPTTTLSATIDLGAANSKLVSGNNILAIHLLNATVDDATSYLKASLQIASSPVVPLINFNDQWKYFPGVVEPSGNVFDPTLLGSGKQNVLWGRLNYDDAAWQTGTGPFGFGSVGAVGTNTQAAMLNITPSLYTRLVFNASAAQAAETTPLKLVVGYDDGFVAYVNGVEVARRRMGTDGSLVGSPNTFTPYDAVASINQSSVQNETINIDIASNLLVAGNNVLAIQTHNFTNNNSDFLISASLQTNSGAILAANNSTAWKYFAGIAEPVTPNPDGEETDSSPEGPDSATDWVEIHNNGTSAVSLDGWRLTDRATNLAKWTFPNVNIPAGGYLVVICDNKNITSPATNGFLHTNFKLDDDGEYLALVNVAGTVVSELAPAYPAQLPFQSYARDSGVWKYSDTPTPGGANVGPYSLGIVATPTVNLPGRHYPGSQSVSLTTTTVGATIRYTTDGSEPVETSTVAPGALTISTNTALRARAFLANYLPSDTITHSYLINQSTARKSLPALCLTGSLTRTFYRPFGVFAIVNNTSSNYMPDTGGAVNSIWSNHPSSTANPPNTAEDTSLYNATLQSGKPAERGVALEILHTDATPDLRTGAFIRCAGSPYSRPRYKLTNHNSVTPNSQSPWPASATEKPQINLFFRDDLGPSPLEYPLVPGSIVNKYENIRIRAGKNDISNPFIRDEFMRRLSLDMGQVTVRGDFVNVYINGVFKGYFNICERPREPFFREARQSDADFDVRNISVITSGDPLAYNELVNFSRTTNQSTYANYQAMQTRLDVVNFADYIVLNAHAATWDWPQNNYVMDRERTTDGVYRFSVWDGEGGFGGGVSRNSVYRIFNDINSGNISSESLPVRLFYSVLKNSPEWRLLVADRIQKHYFNGGALTNSNIQNRWNALATQIQPILQEVTGQTVNSTLFNQYLNGQGDTTRYNNSSNFPSRRTVMLTGYIDDTASGAFVNGYFKTEGLWPNTSAPVFSQHGGSVATGFSLTITNPNATGTIYYTTNGFDPRAVGGAVFGTAYTGPIAIGQTTLVKARVLNTNGEWSPLSEATFTTPSGVPLIISEIMYNPPDIGLVDGDEFEFLEIKNTGASPVVLAGMKFTAGIDYTFPAGASLAPGAFLVLAKNTAQFNAKYPGITVFGQYGPGTSLSNGPETVTLADVGNNPIFSVLYGDSTVSGWPAQADGAGYSLVPIAPNEFINPNRAGEWRRSTNLGGSPGQDDPSSVAPVYITELLANPSSGQVDAIELYNPGSNSVDLSHWWLSDSVGEPKKYQIPSGTTIPGGSYLTFTEAQFNPTPGVGNSFEFNKYGGEDAVVVSGDASGNLTGFTHRYASFGATSNGVSLGRYFDSLSRERFVQQVSTTLGAANAGPKVGPIVISEVMYNAPASLSGIEFIELYNISANAVPLFDSANPTRTWRMNGVEFTFPQNVTMQPRQVLLLTSADPAAFRTAYGVPNEVVVYRYTPGTLADNGGELVSLQMPADTQAPVNTFIEVDSVAYQDFAPWPAPADGAGSSLERKNWRAFGDDVINWQASAANGTPGFLTPSTFAQWQAVYFTAGEISNPSIGGSNADPDNDLLTNFFEFALGRDPRANDSANAWAVTLENDGATGPYLTLRYRRNLGASGAQWHVDTAAEVGTWTFDGSNAMGSAVNNGDGTETVTRRDTQTTSQAAKRFIRLRVNN
jgi:hypothetical protein